MKIKVTILYSILFSALLLAQLYIPSFKINMFLQLGILGFLIFTENGNFSVSFFKKITPLLILFVFPLIVGLLYGYRLGNIIKDVFYFLKPILGISLGYLFFKRINDFRLFLKTIILTGLISALIHFILLIFFTNFWSGSVSQIREYGKDNFLELFGLILLWYSNKLVKQNLFKKLNSQVILFILSLSSLLYLSRTMFVVAILLILAIKGYTIITFKAIKIISIFVVGLFILYAYLFSVKIDRNATGIDSFLYKLKIAPSEIFVSKVNRENHKDLWDHWRAYEALRAIDLMSEKTISYGVGTGYGSLINLKFYAPLGDSDKGLKFISETHNGYIFVFYKAGFLGLFLMLFFLIGLYKLSYVDKNAITLLISGIAITYFFTTLTITGIFNKRDIIIFVLGGFLYFQQKQQITINAKK